MIGAQFGINALAGRLYPSFMRANGVGFGLGVARFGAIASSMVGGILLGQQVPLSAIFYIASAPLGVTIVATIALAMNRVLSARPAALVTT